MSNTSDKPSFEEKEAQIARLEEQAKKEEALQAVYKLFPQASVFIIPDDPKMMFDETALWALQKLMVHIEDEGVLERTLREVLLKCDTRYLNKEQREHISSLQEFVVDLAKIRFREESE